VYHAKFARNEIYALFPPLTGVEPPLENPTVTPVPGDLCYFSFEGARLGNRAHGYDRTIRPEATVVDLALFYERNNLLLNGDVGWVPGTVWGEVVEGLEEMAALARAEGDPVRAARLLGAGDGADHAPHFLVHTFQREEQRLRRLPVLGPGPVGVLHFQGGVAP